MAAGHMSEYTLFGSMFLLKRRQYGATEFVFFIIIFCLVYIGNESSVLQPG